MKKLTLILVIVLMAAPAFTQTSRRTTNNSKPAGENQEMRRTANTNTSVKRTSDQNNSSTTQINRNTQVRNSRTVRTSVPTRNTSGNTTVTKSVPRESSYSTRETHGNVNTGINRNREDRAPETRQTPNYVEPRVNRNANTHTTYYESPRVYREHHTVRHVYHTAPAPVYYRAKHYPYRHPVHISIVWTSAMRTEYFEIYPMVAYWRYPVGYRIETVSAYEADFYRGEVVNVYGKVEEVFYTGRTDEYILYFGAYYPYHDFSVVIPGDLARMYSRWPELYFENQHMAITGLITIFDNKPEIVVKRRGQISLY